MRRLLISAVVLMILIINGRGIHAQEPPKWPPDPDVLFAEGVEIVEASEPDFVTSPTPPEPSNTRCGRLILTPDAEVALIKKNEQYYICELTTGALSQPILNNLYHLDFETVDGKVLELSSGKQWTSFVAYQHGKDEHLWAYERATRKFVDLGKIPFWENYYQKFGWASNTELYLMTRDSPEWSNMYAYVAKVPIENSLREAMMSYRFWINYYDDPPRFETINTPGNDERYWYDRTLAIDCTRSVYDFATRLMTVYHYGNLCLPEYRSENGAEYYRDVQSDGKAWLVRFDVKTRERHNLYYGEIERLHWVSEDEHYALVTLDSSGKTECRPGFEYTDTSADGCWSVVSPVLTLIDLTTGHTLFTTPSEAAKTADYGRYIETLDQNTLIVSLDPQSATSFYIQLYDGYVDTQTLDGQLALNLDSHRLILRRDGSGDIKQFVGINLLTHMQIPITNQLPDYDLFFRNGKDNTVIVTVMPSRGFRWVYPSMEFRLKLPEF